jgi:hypothetical protein
MAKDASRQTVQSDAQKEVHAPSVLNSENLAEDVANYLRSHPTTRDRVDLINTLNQAGLNQQELAKLGFPQLSAPPVTPEHRIAPEVIATRGGDTTQLRDSADAIATRQRLAEAAGHHTARNGKLGNCASSVQNDMIEADPSLNKWAGSGRWNQPGEPQGAWTMGENMLRSGEFVQIDPRNAQPGDIIFFHDQNPKDAGDVQMIKTRNGDTYESWNDKPTPYIDNVNGLGDKRHARIGGMYDHSMVLRFVGDHEYNPRPDANAVSNREPLETWTQADTRGAPASTSGGRDIEKIALSKLGRTIDDGYASEGCMDSISQHVVKPHLATLGLAASYKGFNNTQEFIAWANKHPELVEVQTVSQPSLSATAVDRNGRKMLEPGDIVIGNKHDGPHAMVAARITGRWQGSAAALTLLGNTGHPEYVTDGPDRSHFRYQEFIGTPGDEVHFSPYHGGPESENPANPYYKTDAHGRPTSTWTIIRFRQ